MAEPPSSGTKGRSVARRAAAGPGDGIDRRARDRGSSLTPCGSAITWRNGWA